MQRKILVHIGFSIVFTIFFFFGWMQTGAWAIPTLQIYIPDAEYDEASETWIINSYNYELYVVGATKDEEMIIQDVKIALAVPEEESGSITIEWVDPGNADYGNDPITELTLVDPDLDDDSYRLSYDDYRDSYEYEDPDPSTYGWAEDSTPQMGDGSYLPPHGVFPTDFYEYFIGDLGYEEQVYNYIPGDEYMDTGWGETKIFDISVQGYTWVDIVAYDHIILSENKARYVFSPFSHDGASTVPEPATMLLVGTGMIGLAVGRYRKKRR